MKRVITYGTYDLLHRGHIRLLERAKALGDYLIVGVTSDDYDRSRGKINVAESLMQRIESVRRTGLADEIIIEEYDGQKIDDIRRLGVDIFTVGSDWEGKFDYLRDYCQVVYLDRTDGVSSSELRAKERGINMGIIGSNRIVEKYIAESRYVNGLTMNEHLEPGKEEEFFSSVDAVYIVSHPSRHYEDVKMSLIRGKHVLCESPIALTPLQVKELYELADTKGVILADGIKTAYSTAYSRLIGMAKSGKIGNIVSVDSTCTSLRSLEYSNSKAIAEEWNSLSAWGPTALLPIIDLLGSEWLSAEVISRNVNDELQFDDFSKISLLYPAAVSSAKFGKGVKSEGELVISGTKGYFYVPAPWWKTDYFEIRYENPADNRRYFYQLDGEGIRNELVSFQRMINGSKFNPISRVTSAAIAALVGNDPNIDGKTTKTIKLH